MKKKNLIFAIVYLAYTAIYIARLNLSVATPVFVDLGIADAAQIGLLKNKEILLIIMPVLAVISVVSIVILAKMAFEKKEA